MTLPSGPLRQGAPSPARPLVLPPTPQPPMPPSPGTKEPKRNRKNSGASYDQYKAAPGLVEGYSPEMIGPPLAPSAPQPYNQDSNMSSGSVHSDEGQQYGANNSPQEKSVTPIKTPKERKRKRKTGEEGAQPQGASSASKGPR